MCELHGYVYTSIHGPCELTSQQTVLYLRYSSVESTLLNFSVKDRSDTTDLILYIVIPERYLALFCEEDYNLGSIRTPVVAVSMDSGSDTNMTRVSPMEGEGERETMIGMEKELEQTMLYMNHPIDVPKGTYNISPSHVNVSPIKYQVLYNIKYVLFRM